MAKDGKEDEVTVFVDFFPNLIRNGRTKDVENILEQTFKKDLPEKIARYGKLPYLMIQLGPFNSYLQEARKLYVDEYYRAAVALCGMTVEALCLEIARERVPDYDPLKTHLVDPSNNCRKKIDYLKKHLRIPKSASLLHQVLDIRIKYLHIQTAHVLPEEVLGCINILHLAVIAEYGLMTAEEGKVRPSSEEDVDQLARDMKLEVK